MTSSIRARANVATSLSSPTKAGQAMSKKQQKLAEAAKTSCSISQYFVKKQTVETSQAEGEKGLNVRHSHLSIKVATEASSQHPHPPAIVEAVDTGPLLSETQCVIEEKSKTQQLYIIISDDDEQAETHKLVEEKVDLYKESSTE